MSEATHRYLHALVVVAGPPAAPRVLDPDAAPLHLGRDPSCAIHLDHPGVSRRHATLIWQAGRWWVRDEYSTNGVWVDGERIERPTPLRPGCTVQFGTVVLGLLAPPVAPSELLADIAAARALAVALEARVGDCLSRNAPSASTPPDHADDELERALARVAELERHCETLRATLEAVQAHSPLPRHPH